ncbi:MAG: hypothetical protein FWF24_01810 [Alphaproteobacteria bacterium]|nr:hypothetical protein [Alphaproteobacteria bacterium]
MRLLTAKTLIFFILFALTGQAAGAQALDAPTVFTGAIEDLPLMNGLDAVAEEDVLFLGQKERIAQTIAKGYVEPKEIYGFYAQTLPHMGWQKISSQSYKRDQEILLIHARKEKDTHLTVVQFEVHPSGR